MTLFDEGWRRLRRIWRRRPEQDVDAEVQFHLDERIAELLGGGADADHARAQAVHEFGDVAGVRASLVDIDQRITRRRAWSERWEWLGQDLGYVLRSLRRSPGFVVTVTLTLALGLGANVAIFSVLDRLFLSAPPGVVHPEQVRRIYRYYRVDNLPAYANARPLGDFTVFAFGDLHDIAAIAPAGALLGGYTRNRDDSGAMTTFVLGGYFTVLGVQPVLGRFFTPDEVRVESNVPVAIISHRLWQSQFDERADIVGQSFRVDGHPYTIVGVTPGNFHGADNGANDIWLPVSALRWAEGNSPDWYQRARTAQIKLITRVRTPAEVLGVTRAATLVFRRSDIKADINPVAQLWPLSAGTGPDVDQDAVAMTTRLAGVSLVILLIACANIANLLLARGMRRRREIAVRLAMGVSRHRLIGLLLAESMAISMIAGTVAISAAVPGAAVLRQVLMPQVHWTDFALNWHVALFALLLTLITGVSAGIVPAWRVSRPDIATTLKAGAREGTFQRSRVRTTLLMTQAALSVLLLAGAGLFVRSLRAMETTDVGYDANRLVFASIRAAAPGPQAEIWASLPALALELGRLPGVERTALASNVPMASSWAMTVFLPGGDSLVTETSFVSPSYAPTVGLAVLRGRGLNANDSSRPMSAVVVNALMARTLWPGRDPIGQCLIQRKRANACSTVVGVVSDAHEMGINEAQSLKFYRPLADEAQWGMPHTIALRATPNHASLVADEVRHVLRDRFAGWAVPTVRQMTESMSWELRPRRVGAALFSAAGLLALLVAMVGIYSTISYTFSQRTHEIGVRVALGARATSVIRLVVGEGVRIVMLGVVIGVALALAGGRLVASMLYHTSPHDPVVLITVSMALLAIAAVACLAPAWRAARVDPVIALRAE